jgi:RHS repeat-associated protein
VRAGPTVGGRGLYFEQDSATAATELVVSGSFAAGAATHVYAATMRLTASEGTHDFASTATWIGNTVDFHGTGVATDDAVCRVRHWQSLEGVVNPNIVLGNGTLDATACEPLSPDDWSQIGATDITHSASSIAFTILPASGAAGGVLLCADGLGNLRTVVLPNGTLLEYVIDPQNRRVGKMVDGVLSQGFLYEGQLRTAAELDGGGNVVARFVYGTRVNVPDYMITYDTGGTVTGTYRLVTDHLGSVRLVVDTRPDPVPDRVVQRIDYDEFGRVTLDTNPGFQPFGFAGGLYDRDTGLVRFGARDYDATTGRWTTIDPVRFDGEDTNLFAYVFNDPINGRMRSACGLKPGSMRRSSPTTSGDSKARDPRIALRTYVLWAGMPSEP